MPNCRSCNARIFWTVTSSGRRMPVDEEETPDGNLIIVAHTLHADPQVRYLRKGETVPPEVARYVSHFATCPNAKQHRRPE